MWIKSQNSEELQPPKFYQDNSGVILRRNFVFIEQESEEQSAHWEYEEWQMSKKQYEVYKYMQEQNNELTDALIELADLVAG